MRRALFTLLLALAACSVHLSARADDSLYRAFGEKPGIQVLMQDFVQRLTADTRTARFFKDTKLPRLVDLLSQQVCKESGGPCVYEGDPMGPVHKGLEIGRGDFNALVEVLQQSMDARGVPFSAQNALLARLAPMHRDVVTK